MTAKNNKKTAFSLIELSIVIMIIAIIISGAATISETSIKKAKKANTINKLEQIKEAINIYAYINKKLPCPASFHAIETDSDYAKSVGDDGNCIVDSGSIISSQSGANEMVYGALPAKTLGLSSELAKDDFGNKFSYIVAVDLTEKYSESGNLGFEAINDEDTDLITIKEGISASNIT